jgi:hypothetical protein
LWRKPFATFGKQLGLDFAVHTIVWTTETALDPQVLPFRGILTCLSFFSQNLLYNWVGAGANKNDMFYRLRSTHLKFPNLDASSSQSIEILESGRALALSRIP